MEISEKKKDKMKISIIVLLILVVISLTVTITLAAFQATRSGSITLSFSDGLTMVLTNHTPSNNSYKHFTGGGVDSYTFNYPVQQNLTSSMSLDGVDATLNKSAYVSIQMILYEKVLQGGDIVSVAPTGAWHLDGDGVYRFNPTGERKNWRVVISEFNKNLFNVTISGNSFTAIGNALWASADLANITLWSRVTFRGNQEDGYSQSYVNDLSGRAFEVQFTVKANTASAPTFS